MKRKKITATIDGISYKIDSYEHTTEFGNRNKDTVAEFLKDSYEGNIDENYNFDTYNSLTPNWYYKVLR